MESIPSGRLHESADLFEGDIAGIESIVDVRNAVLDLNLRWPQGVIPYVITTAFSKFSNRAKSFLSKLLMQCHLCRSIGADRHRPSHSGIPQEYVHSIRAADRSA